MKKFILLTLIILIPSCSKDIFVNKDTEKEFSNYIVIYEMEKVKFLGEGLTEYIPIFFKKLKGNQIGLCTEYTRSWKTPRGMTTKKQITIDPDFWNKKSTTEIDKMQLIFHEMGHCDLNRRHDNSFYGIKPKSIMHENHFKIKNKEEFDFYVRELFTKETR